MATTPNGITMANDALASAKKALADAGSSSVGTRSGHSGLTPSKPATPAASPSDYSHVREARKSDDREFMGVKADSGAELKAAQENREAAKKVLNQ
jgi:hypothetical protein